jgi:hypothetical protein
VNDLDSVRVKIARGRQHLDSFNRECERFRNSNPHDIVFEVEAESGDQLIKASGLPTVPPVMPVISDILSNFRSALDHLAYQLVIRAGKQPTNRTYFPLFNDPARYARDSPAQTAGMSQEMIDIIRRHQPCFGDNPYANQALWALQEYGNIDKHRRLLVTVSATGGMFWQPSGPASYVHEGPVQHGTILARFPAGYHKQQVHPVSTIAFGEGAAIGEDIQAVLSLLGVRVPQIVDEFERTFFY